MKLTETSQYPSEALRRDEANREENPSGQRRSRAPDQTTSPENALPAWVRQKIDAAVKRHLGRCTPAQVAAFREQIGWTLATHPTVTGVIEMVPLRRTP